MISCHRYSLRALAIPLLLGAWACSGGGDIRPGEGAAGVRLGDGREAVEKALGTPESTSVTGISGTNTRETTYLLYPAKGIDVLLDGDEVKSIFLYNEGVDDHKRYPGKGPQGITLGSKRADVIAALGQPSAKGLGADIDSWYRYDAGLEVTFHPDGTLHHLVITRSR